MDHVATLELSFVPRFQPGFGLPEDQLARIAARRSFVEMKRCFFSAASDIEGASGALLQRQVRSADDVAHLGRLRVALLDALTPTHERTVAHREALQRHVDALFPDSGPDTCFVPL